MLFIFEDAGIQCMWMKNTLIPLSVAYIADDGAIVNIEDMKPQTEDSHCTKKPVCLFALEMNLWMVCVEGKGMGATHRALPADQQSRQHGAAGGLPAFLRLTRDGLRTHCAHKRAALICRR